MTDYEDQLKAIIANGGGEREVMAFLAKYPFLVRWAVCKTGGHSTYILKEFPFGARFKADFVVAMSYSFAWDVHLIELEPPGDMIITQKGLPSNRLNTAISQLKDWKGYIDQNPLVFKQDLTDWCMKKDLLKESPGNRVPTNMTGNLLNAPDTHIRFHYHVFIGNRDCLDPEKVKKLNQYRSYDLNLNTFGRFVDIARNHDDYYRNPMSPGHRMTKSEEEDF